MKKISLKPFQKYVFEIIVIFIGITISFMFDEWRNSRQDDQKKREYYTLLLDDILADSASLANLVADLRFEQPRLDSALHKTNYADMEKFSRDMCAAFSFKRKQNLIKSFESIKQSGELKLFTSEKLIRMCNSILAKQEQLNVTLEAQSEIWSKYRAYLGKSYPDMALFCTRYQSRIFKGKITAGDVTSFLNDPQVLIYYNDLLWLSNAIDFYVKEIRVEIEALKAELK